MPTSDPHVDLGIQFPAEVTVDEPFDAELWIQSDVNNYPVAAIKGVIDLPDHVIFIRKGQGDVPFARNWWWYDVIRDNKQLRGFWISAIAPGDYSLANPWVLQAGVKVVVGRFNVKAIELGTYFQDFAYVWGSGSPSPPEVMKAQLGAVNALKNTHAATTDVIGPDFDPFDLDGDGEVTDGDLLTFLGNNLGEAISPDIIFRVQEYLVRISGDEGGVA